MTKDLELPDSPDSTFSARSLLYRGLAQTDVDMNHKRLLNLDDSNLGGAPPTINPPGNDWLHSWNKETGTWGVRHALFSNLGGFLTDAQMAHISRVGTITIGNWQATMIAPSKVPTLDAIRSPVAPVNLQNHRLTGLPDPDADTDAVNRRYVHAFLPGLHPKEAVQCATTTNITLFGLQTVDGHPLGQGQRILVKNQTNEAKNGIWRAFAGANWQRSDDCNTAAELQMAIVWVNNGNENGSSNWVQINTITTLETSPVHFVHFSSGTSGPPGPPGPGVPAGGLTNYILKKRTDTWYDTGWADGFLMFGDLAHSLPDDAAVVPVAPEGPIFPIDPDAPDVIGTPVDGMALFYWGIRPRHSIWMDGSLLYGDVYHSTPDDAVVVWGPPAVIGPPVNGMVLAFDDARTRRSIWIDGSNLFGDIHHSLPDGGSTGMILGKWVGAPNGRESIWFDGWTIFAKKEAGLPAGGVAGQVLTKHTTSGPPPDPLHDYDVLWMTPTPDGAVYNISQSAGILNPAGTVSTTPKMMGLNQPFTAMTSGKILVTVSGSIYSDSDGGGAVAQIRAGTGTPPVNGVAPPAGSIAVGALAGIFRAGANVSAPFSLTWAMPGLGVGAPFWLDLQLSAVAPGKATVFGIAISIAELA